MERRTHYIFASIILLGLAGWWFEEWGSGAAASTPDAMMVATAQPQSTSVSDPETQRQFEVLEQDKQAFAEELSRRDAERSKRDRAGAKTEEFRKQLQFTKANAWSRVIFANSQAFQNLRILAAASHDGYAPCTICNGRGAMDFCVLCENTGKCPTCHGTGLLNFSGTELCPTCLGTGKCYLCGGTGKMVCPFCNDGIVDKAKLPSSSIPLN